MKNLIILLLLIISNFCISQTRNYDIYILLDDTIESNLIHYQNDTLVLQVFVIEEQGVNYKHQTYFIDNKGDLKTDIQIKGNMHSNAFNLIYKNINNFNKPIIRKSKNVKNILKYPKDFKNQNINDMYKLLNEANQLYIIETDKTLGYYLVKKVEMGQRLGGL